MPSLGEVRANEGRRTINHDQINLKYHPLEINGNGGNISGGVFPLIRPIVSTINISARQSFLS